MNNKDHLVGQLTNLVVERVSGELNVEIPGWSDFEELGEVEGEAGWFSFKL